MAPTFLNNVDDVPVETQLILLELPLTVPEIQNKNQNSNSNGGNNYRKNSNRDSSKDKSRDNNQSNQFLPTDEEGNTVENKSKLFSDKSFVQKKYAIIAPLIDFDRGFRTTLFGGKEGGYPVGKGVLAARIESGTITYHNIVMTYYCHCVCVVLFKIIVSLFPFKFPLSILYRLNHIHF